MIPSCNKVVPKNDLALIGHILRTRRGIRLGMGKMGRKLPRLAYGPPLLMALKLVTLGLSSYVTPSQVPRPSWEVGRENEYPESG